MCFRYNAGRAYKITFLDSDSVQKDLRPSPYQQNSPKQKYNPDKQATYLRPCHILSGGDCDIVVLAGNPYKL